MLRMRDGVRPRIGLDTNCVRYYLANERPWADWLEPFFEAATSGKAELFVSTVVVAELLAGSYYANRAHSGYDPELDLLAILDRHFQVVDVNATVAKAAGRLRGSFLPGDKMVLKLPDAIVGGTSLALDHSLFITNDERLADALPDDRCLFLGDLAPAWLAEQFPTPCLRGSAAVSPVQDGEGVPLWPALASPELASIKLGRAVPWQRVLHDGFIAAAILGVPCVVAVLEVADGTSETEVIFWHDGPEATQSAGRLVNRVSDYLGFERRTQVIRYPERQVRLLCFSSLQRQRELQDRSDWADKLPRKKEVDAWRAYVKPLIAFSSLLGISNVPWILCEQGIARELDTSAAGSFAQSVSKLFGEPDAGS